jgi:hypothetical protein
MQYTLDNTLHKQTQITWIRHDWLIDLFIVLNATFSNISAISWRPVLVVEEVGVPGENHGPWASNW